MIKQIRYFIEVVNCNSFTEAAERCFISQSAISQQINVLEEDLGVKLLKREKRRFSLTPAGEYLYRNSPAILEKVDELRRETVRIGQDEEVPLKIGYLIGYEGKELQDTIFDFTEQYPEVVLSSTVMKISSKGLLPGRWIWFSVTREELFRRIMKISICGMFPAGQRCLRGVCWRRKRLFMLTSWEIFPVFWWQRRNSRNWSGIFIRRFWV